MGRVSHFLLILLAVGLFFETCNLLTTVIHNNGLDRTVEENWIDPVIQMPRRVKITEKPKLLFHVAVTADDSPYTKWQCRIMYYWYKKVKDLHGSEMGGFTRVLHSGKPDDLMEEMPTFVVDPLPAGLDRGYIVLNRPWAFVQWLEKATIEEEYVLMAEPDHIFVNPLPNLANGETPAAFPFFYINPAKHEKIIRKFFPEDKGPVTNVDPIGSSPVIIKKTLLEKIAPTWMNVSLKMKDDRVTDRSFGWILEMYAYAVASALHGVQHILHKDFMVQPPMDEKVGDKFIIHYTYRCVYLLTGKQMNPEMEDWFFDKRSFEIRPPPKNFPLPPKGAPESVVTLIRKMNEASANIPGWDTLKGEDLDEE